MLFCVKLAFRNLRRSEIKKNKHQEKWFHKDSAFQTKDDLNVPLIMYNLTPNIVSLPVYSVSLPPHHQNMTFTVHDLSPSRDYEVWLSAISEAGPGANASTTFTTKHQLNLGMTLCFKLLFLLFLFLLLPGVASLGWNGWYKIGIISYFSNNDCFSLFSQFSWYHLWPQLQLWYFVCALVIHYSGETIILNLLSCNGCTEGRN